MFIVRWNVIIVPIIHVAAHFITSPWDTVGQEEEEIERNATMFDQEIFLLVGNIFTFSCLNLTEGSETWTEFLEVSLVRRPSHARAVQHSWSSL